MKAFQFISKNVATVEENIPYSESSLTVAVAQPQHDPFLASPPSSLVLSNPIMSSAIVGWMPTHESNYSFVSPHLNAIPTPYVISPALGAQIWKPTTLLLSAKLTRILT